MIRVVRPLSHRDIRPMMRSDKETSGTEPARNGGPSGTPVAMRGAACRNHCEENVMSTYKVIEVIGTSTTSWEDAAAEAVKTAGETLHDLRVAEVVRQDIHLDESGGITFRTKLELSFRYEHQH